MAEITPICILSYPKLLEPVAGPSGGDPKFGAALVFPEGTDYESLKRAAVQVVVGKFGKEKAAEMLRNGTFQLEGGKHHTIRTDNTESKGYGPNAAYINARTGTKPRVVDATVSNELSDAQIAEVMVAGAVVKASVVPYWYDVNGNKGVAWGLNNLQYLGPPGSAVDPRGPEGQRLDNYVAPQDEFEPVEGAVGDLSDLTGDEAEEEEDTDIASLLS